jgi:hypothetical protein
MIFLLGYICTLEIGIEGRFGILLDGWNRPIIEIIIVVEGR